MTRRLTLRTRLLVPSLGILALGLGVLVFVVVTSLSSDLEKQARFDNAMIATRYATQIGSEMNRRMEAARSLARSFLVLYRQGTRSREVYNDLLKSELVAHAGIHSVWTIWEPNVLGADRSFKNQPGNDATGRFVPSWTKGPDQPVVRLCQNYDSSGSGDYYQVPKTTGKEGLMDPQPDPAAGPSDSPVQVVPFGVPIVDNGRVLGVVGVDLDLTELTKTMNGLKFLKTGYAVLVTNSGFRATHPRPELIGKRVGDDTPKDKDALLAAFQKGDEYVLTKTNLRDGSRSLLTYEPVGKGQWDKPWSLVAISPLDQILQIRDRIAGVIFLVGLLIFIAIGVAVGLVVGRVTAPVRHIAGVLRTIADGQGDLTQRLALQRTDEIGDLSRSYDAFVDRLSDMIRMMQATAGNLRESGGGLAAALTESAASLHEITANIQSAKDHIVQQEQIASKTAVAVQTISSHVETLQGLVSRQDRAVETSGSAVEQMVGNIESVTRNVGTLGQSLQRLVDAAEQGRSQFQSFRERVTAVDSQSDSLQETNEVIASIAGQTNLLAMNAAIEAAHAGEAGKGFAVVSDEIRKLAEQASTQSKSTAQELKTLQTTIRALVGDAQATEGAFTRILEDINHVERLGSEVESAMNEQQIGSRQILDGIHDIREASHEVSGHSQAMGAEAEVTLRTMETLHGITTEIRHGMDEIATGTSDINQAVASISVQGERNRENVEKLALEASAFRILEHESA